MGALALFLVIAGGTAYAANTVGSSDIIDESIQSVDVKNGEVTAADLANNSVRSTKIAKNQIQSVDVKELSQFSEASSGVGGCTADTGAPTVCATKTIVTERPGRLLVNATGAWKTFALDGTTATDDPTLVIGTCELQVNGAAITDPQHMGERSTGASVHPDFSRGTLALTGLSASLPPGQQTVDVNCRDTDRDIDWPTINLTAALVAD